MEVVHCIDGFANGGSRSVVGFAQIRVVCEVTVPSKRYVGVTGTYLLIAFRVFMFINL